MSKRIMMGVVFLVMCVGFSPSIVLAQQDTIQDLELRIAKLEAQIESMSEDMASWRTFLANFQKGAQGVKDPKEAGTHDIDLGMPGHRPTRSGDGLLLTIVKEVPGWVAEGAEKLGTMVGNWEAGPPAELQKPPADQRPPADNYSTSGQQGHAGQR